MTLALKRLKAKADNKVVRRNQEDTEVDAGAEQTTTALWSLGLIQKRSAKYNVNIVMSKQATEIVLYVARKTTGQMTTLTNQKTSRFGLLQPS